MQQLESIEFTTQTWGDWKRRTNSNRLRFALIMTGGTIVSVPDKEGALVPAEHPEQLLAYAPHLMDEVDITIVKLMNLDSSNLRPVEWRKIAAGIMSRYNHYDGFLVTHGTDTMSYSASAVRFALGNYLYNPVVFTGAQLPINLARTDAIINLEDALATLIRARRERVRGVFIVAGRQIHEAVRSIKKSADDFDFVSSPVTGPVGLSTAVGIEWEFGKGLPKVKLGPEDNRLPLYYQEDRRTGKEILRWTLPNYKDGVVTIKLEPNTGADVLSKLLLVDNPPYRAIVFSTHGAGNPPDWSLDLVRELIERRTPVIITPPESGMSTAVIYKTAKEAEKLGAIQTGDMTPPAAQVKLSWLLSRTSPSGSFEYLSRFFPKDYFGEITETRE